MAKGKTRNADWFKVLIKKVGTETVTGKKLWELVEETNTELDYPKLPLGSRHLVLGRLQKSGVVDIITEGKTTLLSIRDTDKLIAFVEDDIRRGGRAKKTVEVKVKEPKSVVKVKPTPKETDDKKEAFIKYFKCLRCAVRSKTDKLDLKTCLRVNRLKRIQPKHVLYWAKVVNKLGVSITMPLVHKNGSDIKIEFKNREEELLKICKFGEERYPENKSEFIPEEAFGSSETVKRVYREIEDKKRKVVKPVEKVVEKKIEQHEINRPITNLEHAVIFYAAELIRSGGIDNYVYTADLCATVSKRYDLHLGRKEFEDILKLEPEINLTASAGMAKTKLKDRDSYEKIKKAHGYDVQRKYQILAQINMKPEEITSRFRRLNFKVESEIGQFGYIYNIQCSRSKEDLAVLRKLFSMFRGEDKPFTEIKLYERLRKEAEEVERFYNSSDKDYYADSEAWREDELVRKH